MATNKEIYQDVPEHQRGLTSSVGPLWPPSEASFKRIKAIDSRAVVNSGSHLLDLSEYFAFSCRSLGIEEHSISRVQFRAVVEAELLRQNSGSQELQKVVEAVIPLGKNHLGNEPVLLYLGKNSETRFPYKNDLERIKSNIEKASIIKRRSINEVFSKPSLNGYSVQILEDRDSETSIRELTSLYKRFNWTEEEVSEIVKNQNNIIATASLDGTIVSAGIAETATIPVGGSLLRMAEITEAATLEGHGGQGLYNAVSTSLLMSLTEMSQKKDLHSGEIDLVFGECNGLSLGVLTVAKLQGRTFSTEVGVDFGFPESGILYQQVPINGAERNTPYNDLVPAFLTRETLYENYGR